MLPLKTFALGTIVIAIIFAAHPAANPQSTSASVSDRLLVLYAFDEEGDELAAKMIIAEKDTLLGREVKLGRLADKQVILAESGVGMTNAAMTVQHLIDVYHPQGVIFSGIAGAIDSNIHIGDIAVCDRWVTHDYFYHGPDSIQPRPIWVYSAEADSVSRQMYFAVDSTYRAAADQVARQTLPLKMIGTRKPQIVATGVGVSGNAFIDNADKRKWLSTRFHALVTDMESAAVAQVCTANGVPFIVFRSASDLAGGSTSETASAQLDMFYEVAAFNSATLVVRFISAL